MPKIPTFTSQGRPTTDAPSVRTGIQISPTATPAAGLLPALNQLTDFAIKKRDISEKIESQKIVNNVKGDLDIIIEQEKENINEDESISKLQKSFKNITNQKLNNVKNNRIKKRVQNLLDLEYSGYVNTIKKNSYIALEKDAEKTTNDTLTSIASEYFQATTEAEKLKIRDKGIKVIDTISNDFEFPKNKIKEKLDAFDKVLLFSDFTSFVGKENAIQNILNADRNIGGEKKVSNEEFAAGILNSYQSKINDLTVIGSENSDFEEALDLVEELKTIKRDNGFNVNTGGVKDKINEIEEKILSEKITHENKIEYLTQGKQLNEELKNQKDILGSIFFNQFNVDLSGADNKEKSIEAQQEFDKRFSNYEKINPEATLEEKKDYAVDLRLAIIDRYNEKDIRDITNFNQNKNKFELLAEENSIKKSMTLFIKSLENPELINEDNVQSYNQEIFDAVDLIKRKAILNGFVDQQGNPDVYLFYNTFIEILNNQKKD